MPSCKTPKSVSNLTFNKASLKSSSPLRRSFEWISRELVIFKIMLSIYSRLKYDTKRIEPCLEPTPGCLVFFLNSTPESPVAYQREEEYFPLESFASSLRLLVDTSGPVTSQKK